MLIWTRRDTPPGLAWLGKTQKIAAMGCDFFCLQNIQAQKSPAFEGGAFY
jgi:hypothetical protein